MRLLIYQVDSPYGSLKYFMDCLIKSFLELGIEVTVIDFMRQDAMERLADQIGKKFDAVLSFNSNISKIKLNNGNYLQDYIDAPYYYFIVDHPMVHHAMLREKLHHMHVIAMDYSFVDYIKQYYTHIKSVDVILHGGSQSKQMLPFAERDMDVIFTGSYQSCEKLYEIIMQTPEPARTVALKMIDQLVLSPELTQEQAFCQALDMAGVALEQDMHAEWLGAIGNVVDNYLRGLYRKELVRCLAGASYMVDVYGDNWEQCDIHADNIKFHGPIGFEENIELYGRAKVVLNSYAGFKNGSHDRIFSAMLSGSVCMTDTNQWIETNFSPRENILLYNDKEIMNVRKELDRYFREPERLERIADNGKQLVSGKVSWRERAEEMIQCISGVSADGNN